MKRLETGVFNMEITYFKKVKISARIR